MKIEVAKNTWSPVLNSSHSIQVNGKREFLCTHEFEIWF
jgi:hypothetical protein